MTLQHWGGEERNPAQMMSVKYCNVIQGLLTCGPDTSSICGEKGVKTGETDDLSRAL